jgi:hypothetical protein
MTITNDLLKRIAFAVLGLSLIGYGYWLQSGGRNSASDKPTPVTNAAAGTTESRAPALVKVPIKDMRVGTRVPAFNPEVSAAERRMFTEPNWYQWMKLKLELPKPDGTLLEIEMLRPEDWLIEQVTLVVEPRPAPWLRNSVLPTEEASSLDAITLDDKSDLGQLDSESAFSSSSGSAAPLRPIYYHLTEMLSAAELDGDEVLGLVVELDLPELGISGPAWIIDLEPAPLVPVGPGQVVTATFKHASANVLDLVLTNTQPTSLNSSPSALSSPPIDSIGVTANHPFWSVDRAQFVQAGELQIGERLQTLSGDIHWVQQKLPRPGPEPVYNLEVHAEHVYYVGSEGVLAHNACMHGKNAHKIMDRLAGEIEGAVAHAERVLSIGGTGNTRWGVIYQKLKGKGHWLEPLAKGNAIQQIANSRLASNSYMWQAGAMFNRGHVLRLTSKSGRALRPDFQIPLSGGRVGVIDITTPSQVNKIFKYLVPNHNNQVLINVTY